MPGQRAFDGDVRRLRVADLADHDDIGVVPQNAAQGFRKGDALAINLNLVDAVEGNFDWVLDGQNVVGARFAKLAQSGV